MKQTVKQRLLEFINAEGHSVNFFERKSGLSVGYVRNLKSKVGENKLRDILKAFPRLSERWLLYGEGPMINENAGETEKKETQCELEDQSSYRLVPLVAIDSVGGIHSGNEYTPSEQYVIRTLPFEEAREGDVAILQSGNSMYPTIPPGSALLIREVTDWQEYFGYGGIFVIWLKDGRRITKEVRRYDADPKNYVWCVSYNPDVADEELPKSMIRGVWKVIKYLADFGW